MKAIGYTGKKGKVNPDRFIEFEQPTPVPTGRDLLIKVHAVAVNPVDFKVRKATEEAQDPPRILGWDAAGVVEATGEGIQLFKPGDQVFYAGDITRPGSDASHQLVDERIVGLMPATLNFAEAAALPLTSITAWEALFDRIKINPEADASKHLLIIGGAGGVGSIAIQIAKQVARLKVTATASRDVTRQWCLSLGADDVIDHHNDFQVQIRARNLGAPDYILCLNDTDAYFTSMAELIAPQGMICSIVETVQPHNLGKLKSKSAGFVWEFMFTRPMLKAHDMIRQHQILNEIATWVDSGKIQTTLKQNMGPLNPDNLLQAHQLLESGTSLGKIVLTVDE